MGPEAPLFYLFLLFLSTQSEKGIPEGFFPVCLSCVTILALILNRVSTSWHVTGITGQMTFYVMKIESPQPSTQNPRLITYIIIVTKIP